MQPTPNQNSSQYSTGLSMTILILLFFMWGFITCMNDILIPHLKDLFQLSYLQAMLVQFAFFGAYFIGSLLYFFISYLYGDPIVKIGYKGGIALGLIISALGCVLFYPAESLKIYSMFLLALFTLGLGFTLLQISANPYVAILGRPEDASSRLNLAQGFNSLGTTIAPIIGGYLIFELFNQGDAASADSTKIPYIIFAVTFLLLTAVILLVKLPKIENAQATSNKLGAFAYPQLKGGVLAIFFYVGAEVAIGSLMISYIELPEILGADEHVAKNYLSLYWGGAMIGRFLGAISLNGNLNRTKQYMLMLLSAVVIFTIIYFIVDISLSKIWPFILFIGLNFLFFIFGRSLAHRVLLIFALVNVLLLLITITASGVIALWSLIAIGLFNSIMWSNIFTIAIKGLKSDTSQGSSLLVMGILGAALIPLLQGWMADEIGLKPSFILPILSYLYIAAYGYYCRRFKDEELVSSPVAGGH